MNERVRRIVDSIAPKEWQTMIWHVDMFASGRLTEQEVDRLVELVLATDDELHGEPVDLGDHSVN